MKHQLIVLFAFFALSANANAETHSDPYSDYLNLEIEKVELEQELFGIQTNNGAVSIASLELYKVEEVVDINFDTKNYLPEDFDAEKGMNEIDWNKVDLYELEEEVDLGFDTKAHLPDNFNAYEGMSCNSSQMVYSY